MTRTFILQRVLASNFWLPDSDLASLDERRGLGDSSSSSRFSPEPAGMRWRVESEARCELVSSGSLTTGAAPQPGQPSWPPPLNCRTREIIPHHRHLCLPARAPPKDGVLCSQAATMRPVLPLLSDLYNCDSGRRGGCATAPVKAPRGLASLLLWPP